MFSGARYKDRIDAGNILAESLAKYKGKDGVVLAIPRGGVPVGYVVAKALNFSLDIALSKKIGHPLQKEYAIGAVSLAGSFISDRADVPESYIKSEEQKIKNRLREMYREFMGNRHPENVAGRTVIIVDDGIATGNTILATLKMVESQEPAEIIVAAPIAGQNAVELLSPHADEIVCPIVAEYFMGISSFYEDFEQTSDEEVKYYLEAYRNGFTI